MAALYAICKGLDSDADEEHRFFTERCMQTRRRLLSEKLVTWWGVFDGDQLVGQCGMVFCGEVVRFQDVETHPEFRRRGICSALIRAVAENALRRNDVSRVVLATEVDGPALPLYRRLGVGSQLVEAGLLQCKEAGCSVCFVLGAPEYYQRFGFTPAVPCGFPNPFAADDRNFLVKELRPGALGEHAGNLGYGRQFSKWLKPAWLSA